MTKEQLDRLDYLTTKSNWTLEELMERDVLTRLFYKTFRPLIYFEMIEKASYQG